MRLSIFNQREIKQVRNICLHTIITQNRKVTTNKEKRTFGVDKILWTIKASKMPAVFFLTDLI